MPLTVCTTVPPGVTNAVAPTNCKNTPSGGVSHLLDTAVPDAHWSPKQRLLLKGMLRAWQLHVTQSRSTASSAPAAT